MSVVLPVYRLKECWLCRGSGYTSRATAGQAPEASLDGQLGSHHPLRVATCSRCGGSGRLADTGDTSRRHR